jgi:predicted  nucleic acid-binding Zn-ribbon protein
MQSGLSLPDNRLKAIKHRIDAAEEALKKQKESSILDSLSEKVSEFSDTSKNLSKSTSDFNLDDILGKY